MTDTDKPMTREQKQQQSDIIRSEGEGFGVVFVGTGTVESKNERNELKEEIMPFQLPNLVYKYEDLEPHIDAQTMEIHHSKHHGGYVTKLNAALENHKDLAEKPIEELIGGINNLPDDIRTTVRNNGGGHYNHSLFWTMIGPDGSGEPTGALLGIIKENFGSIDGFRESFAKAATGQFGSGWAWLTVIDDAKLEICSTPNQDNPIMDVTEAEGWPILGLDVWEHAYYLKYQNKRAEYIDAFWNVINWKAVEANYTAAVEQLETAGRT